MPWQETKKLNEERGQKLADMKAMLKKADDEKRDLTAEEEQRFDQLNGEAEKIKSKVERMESVASGEADLRSRLNAGEDAGEVEDPEDRADDGADRAPEQRAQRPGREDRRSGDAERREQREEREGRRRPETRQEREHRQMVLRFFGDIDFEVTPEQRRQLPPEARATVKGAKIVGDREFQRQLVQDMKFYAGVREAGARVLTTQTGNEIIVPTADDTDNIGQIRGEGVTNNDEADPTIGHKSLSAYMYDSKWIKVSIEMLQDAQFAPEVESYVRSIAGERIGRVFNLHTTTGDGNNKPRGILLDALLGHTAAATNAIVHDEIIDLVHSVDRAYRADPSFKLMLHDLTLAAIRKLKDGDGRYIWGAGTAGEPSRILEYQYQVNNDMPHLGGGAGSEVMLAGCFSKYAVRDVTQTVVVRADELFIGDGLIGFRLYSRHDGLLTQPKAVKKLKLAAA